MKLMAESDLVSRVVECLIDHSAKLFSKVPLWCTPPSFKSFFVKSY